jgi:hypothetical protein
MQQRQLPSPPWRARLATFLFALEMTYKDRGLIESGRFFLLRLAASPIKLILSHPLLRPKSFSFQGSNYDYFYHSYNCSWSNERAVEIPIVHRLIGKCQECSILEVGNVLSHYWPCNHEIVDKYEVESGVINKDIVDFFPDRQYDLIVSISTLEHVGWDEIPREPGKPWRAIAHLVELLAVGGTLIVTMPLGLNPEVDRRVSENNLPFDRQYYLKRIAANNRWEEVGSAPVQGQGYSIAFGTATAVVIGIIKKRP